MNATAELPVSTSQRTARNVVVFCAAAWIVALVLMWLTTANPLVVSRAQLRLSDAVVVARVVDRERDVVEVVRVLHGEVKPHDRLTVLNLSPLELPPGEQEWIMPLSSFRGDYRITELDGQRAAPIVYPATGPAIEQTKLLLQGMGR